MRERQRERDRERERQTYFVVSRCLSLWKMSCLYLLHLSRLHCLQLLSIFCLYSLYCLMFCEIFTWVEDETTFRWIPSALFCSWWPTDMFCYPCVDLTMNILVTQNLLDLLPLAEKQFKENLLIRICTKKKSHPRWKQWKKNPNFSRKHWLIFLSIMLTLMQCLVDSYTNPPDQISLFSQFFYWFLQCAVHVTSFVSLVSDLLMISPKTHKLFSSWLTSSTVN